MQQADCCYVLFQWYTTATDGDRLQLLGFMSSGSHTVRGGGALVLLHDQDSLCKYYDVQTTHKKYSSTIFTT